MKPLRCLYILISAFSTYVDAGYGSYNAYADASYGTYQRFPTGNIYTIPTITQAPYQQNLYINRIIPPAPTIYQRIEFIPPPPIYNIIPTSPEPVNRVEFFIPPPPVTINQNIPQSPDQTSFFNNFIPPPPITIPQIIYPPPLLNILPQSPDQTSFFNNFIPPPPITIPQIISPPNLHTIPPSSGLTSLVNILPPPDSVINIIPPSPDQTSSVNIFRPPVNVINITPPSPDQTSSVNIFRPPVSVINIPPPSPDPPSLVNILPNIIEIQPTTERPFGKGDYSFGTSEYYFTWLHNDIQYTNDEAYRFCHNLPGEWYVVSIESLSENQVINNIIEHYKLRFIWIGATKQDGFYRFWDSGEKFVGLNFSPTGRFKTPQPDNAEGRENNIPEDCLAILDKFYPNDGVTWHDIACYHKKVTICERPRLGL